MSPLPLRDALALNIGGDDWQQHQAASAYAAANELGTNFKLFLSFDLSAIGCDVDDLVSRVNQFVNHPNQFRVNGRPMISSFAGKCLGNDGWANIKTRTNGYLMPFIEEIEGKYDAWPSLDSWLWYVELFNRNIQTLNPFTAGDARGRRATLKRR
jgi:glucan endo-1,3-alpha-glucosidase